MIDDIYINVENAHTNIIQGNKALTKAKEYHQSSRKVSLICIYKCLTIANNNEIINIYSTYIVYINISVYIV